MKLHRIRFSISDLRTIPDDERPLLIALAFAINEITVLNKLVAISSHISSGPTWVVQAELAQAMILARTLFGKLSEFWALVQKGYLKSPLSARYQGILPESACKSLASLKQHFGKKSLTNTIRNTMAFHFSLEHAGAEMPTELPGEELSIYMHPSVGNSLYQFAELLMNFSLYEKIAPSNPEKAAHAVFEELSKVVGDASDFGQWLIIEILARSLGDARLQALVDTVDVPTPPSYLSLSLPFYIEMPEPSPTYGV
ncbi:hypothetical protein [Hylemonella gracilis]|uniref:S-adenosyl-L-homocysteine hydrolase n=1 Tax=Hylemonella gracilis ATCC 19624 TaxID=887062 RepID=F3KQW6_9BURK|nr:hypothetical protein [Hylemonella gracilis]EGI77667.1 S-adenosyl-L-homocysteine hydrolase [Hylemonella gracilis ATCC 19624]